MRTKSAKAKGRRLQDLVAQAIRNAFKLKKEDVRPAIMGESGTDIKLSRRAKNLFPYSVECKNQEGLKSVYNIWDQAEANTDNGTVPLCVLKSNRKPPLVLLSLDQFMLLAKQKGIKKCQTSLPSK